MEAINNAESTAKEPVESEHDKTDLAVDGLRADAVSQAKLMLAGLAEVISDENATRILRIMGDLCTTNIGLLTDLDPAGVRTGPRARVSPSAVGYQPLGSGGVGVYEPMVAGGQSNETFGAQALGQIIALLPQIQMGNNAKGLTTALVEAKKEGLGDVVDMLEAKLKSTLGHTSGDPEPEEEPPPIAALEEAQMPEVEEATTECVVCGHPVTEGVICPGCQEEIDEAGTPPAEGEAS